MIQFKDKVIELQEKVKKVLDELSTEEIKEALSKGKKKSFKWSEISDESIKDIPNFPGIYYFKILEAGEKTNENFLKEWNDVRNILKTQGYDIAPNGAEENIKKAEDSNYLYIGKSRNLNKRLKDHLVRATKSTYALKLKLMLEKSSALLSPNKKWDNIEIEMVYLEMNGCEEELLKYIEETLRREYGCLLGSAR